MTVTLTVPLVTVVAVAVVQYAPAAEVITFMVTAVPPVPGDPPVATPPPVPEPPVPLEPPVPVVPPLLVEPPVPLPPVPLLPPVPEVTLSTQALLAQCWVDPQACPQEPQFAALLVVSTQAVPHKVWVPEQLELQLLLLQTWPVVQAIAQLPQWVASDATQEPLQLSMPDGHLHWLSWQVCPPVQGLPQTPQLFASEEVSTQVVPQAVCVPLQVGPTIPPVPPPGVPPVPGLPPVWGLEQAAARITKPKPKTHTRAVVIITLFPGRPKLISPRAAL